MNAEIYKQEKLPLDYDGEEVRADLKAIPLNFLSSVDQGRLSVHPLKSI